MTTKRQRDAISFCERWLNVKFKGDVNNFNQVSSFLSEWLDDAKIKATELSCEYSAYLWEHS